MTLKEIKVCVFFLILTNFLTKETGNPPLTCIIYCLLKKKTNKQTTTTTKKKQMGGRRRIHCIQYLLITHCMFIIIPIQYLKRSLRGILLLKTKCFKKMYSKKTDARGILPNTFRLLRKNYHYYPLRI